MAIAATAIMTVTTATTAVGMTATVTVDRLSDFVTNLLGASRAHRQLPARAAFYNGPSGPFFLGVCLAALFGRAA
ncbi:hypothetical protein D3C72_2188250 [compost metagenome]